MGAWLFDGLEAECAEFEDEIEMVQTRTERRESLPSKILLQCCYNDSATISAKVGYVVGFSSSISHASGRSYDTDA